MSEGTIWRLCTADRTESAFAGEGAYRRGGRWNPRGLRVAYCAESRSLAAMEVLVGSDDKGRLLLVQWVCIPVSIDSDLIEHPVNVPREWREFPHSPATQVFGAEWVQARRTVGLRVPSAVVPGEFNFLLNPAHPDFARVRIGAPEPFNFDPRLA